MATKTATPTTAKPKATAKQVAYLQALGHPADASTLTARQASDLIEALKKDAPTVATVKQIAFLQQLGYTGAVNALTASQASRLIEQLKLSLDLATARIAETVNVRDMAEARVVLRRASSTESAGPCPLCGGDDRFHCTDKWFMCRHCHEKRGDAIEFVRWLNNTTFIEAVRMLDGNWVNSLPTVERLAPTSKPTAKLNDWDETKELTRLISAHKSLITGSGKYAALCRDYLVSRGLTLETAEVFKLGYRAVTLPSTWDEAKKALSYPKQQALMLPWFNRDGTLVAVKYRFTESHEYTDIHGKQRTENKTSRGNFAGNLFGWQAVKGPTRSDVLIITEGEINAPSLWQAGGGLVDVLSTGTESMMETLPDDIIEFAKQYKHRIVWADKGTIADTTARRIGAASMRSRNGRDANDLLQAGKLDELLGLMLRKMGIEAPEKITTPPAIVEQRNAIPAGGNSYPEKITTPPAIVELYPVELPTVATATRLPLPRPFWRHSIADYADAWGVWEALGEFYTVKMGKNEAGFYIVAATADDFYHAQRRVEDLGVAV